MRSFSEYRDLVEKSLPTELASLGPIPERLLEAMNYSLLAGGKRLRPVMLLAACEMAGGETEKALPFALALEMIHTYSLIHDDLPAMDNDDLRRGRPTNHKVFGDGLATLAGDGLLNGAVEIMARAALTMSDPRGLRALEAVMRHAGVTGMIAGQTIDLDAEGQTPGEELLHEIHRHKTADLLQAPMESGLLLAGAPDTAVQAGLEYGLHLGLAFQMTDDLLDVIGETDVLGKQTGMDATRGKMTWITLRGVEGTRRDAETQVAMAIHALRGLDGMDTSLFVSLAQDTLNRVK